MKMYLVSPTVYNKILQDNAIYDGIDKEMIKILRMKKIEDNRKWVLYRQALITYSSRRRNAGYNSEIQPPPLPQLIPQDMKTTTNEQEQEDPHATNDDVFFDIPYSSHGEEVEDSEDSAQTSSTPHHSKKRGRRGMRMLRHSKDDDDDDDAIAVTPKINTRKINSPQLRRSKSMSNQTEIAFKPRKLVSTMTKERYSPYPTRSRKQTGGNFRRWTCVK